jgi:hypothetical protein
VQFPAFIAIAALVMASVAPPVALAQRATTVDDVLSAHRRAVGDDGRPGTLDLRYAYSGQGLTGTTRVVIDRATGAYVDRDEAGPSRSASGYDGRLAWMQDISGAYTPQDGGDRPARAISEAYRNANRWWRPDRGGATISYRGRETIDGAAADHLIVAPHGGKPFDAWFDAATHLLVRTREGSQFLTITTRFADFAREHGMMIAHAVVTDSGTGDSGIETRRLERLDVLPVRALAAYACPEDAPTGASLDGGAASTIVPIRLLNNHIYVEAKVNGQGPYAFMVDTGGHTILTPSTVATLGLHAEGASTSAGAGEKTTVNGFVKVREIAIGAMRMREQTAFALDFANQETEGVDVDGMVGFELFRRFAVRIDYGALTMTIIDPARFDARDAGTPIAFRFYDHLPQVRGTFDGRPGWFDIDTGSRSEIDLTSPFVERAHLRDAYPGGFVAVGGWGVGGPVRSYIVRARSVTLGDVAIDAPVASLSNMRAGSFSDPNYEANVGSGLLKRFVVTFDYAHQRMYLKRIEPQPADAGTFDKSGMWINLGDRGFVVADVAPGGAAQAAGIAVGDVIVAIDGEGPGTLALPAARQRLRTAPDGTTVKVEVLRGAARETRTLTLRSRV